MVLLEEKCSYTPEMTTESRVRMYGGRAKRSRSAGTLDRETAPLRTEMDAPARCRSQLSARITIIRQDKDAVAEFISEPIMRTQTDVPEEPPPRSQLCTQTTYNAFLLYSDKLCL